MWFTQLKDVSTKITRLFSVILPLALLKVLSSEAKAIDLFNNAIDLGLRNYFTKFTTK